VEEPVVMEDRTPKDQEAIDKVQKESAIVFKITVAVLGFVLGGGLLGLVTDPTADRRLFILYFGAVLVGAIGAFVGALVNWRAVLTRVRLLYYSQLIALVGLVGCLLGTVAFLFAGPPPPTPSAVEEDPTVEASAEAPPHQDDAGNWFYYEPKNAIDGVDDTAWRVPKDGKGDWIELEYAAPVKVSEVGVIPGHDKVDLESGADRFYQLYVVRRASIEFSDGTVKEKRFDRDKDMQWLQLNPPEVTRKVRIEIKDTYPPGGNPYPVYETAISEIEVR
jgi:hypothetical protein